MPGPNNEKCGDCKYWEYLNKGEFGVCRVNAPHPAIKQEGKSYQIVWPATKKTEYCIKDFAKAQVN